MLKAKKILAMTLAVIIMAAFMPLVGGVGTAQAAAKPAKVKITKATKTNQMVDLKWKKAKGAKKYQVYMKKGKGKWKKVKTQKVLKFKKNGLKWNTTYQFKVRAINGKKKGQFSKTYKGKIRKKATLAKVLTASQKSYLNADAESAAAQINSNVGGTLISKANVTVAKNNISYNFAMAFSSSDLTLAEKADFETSMKNSMETAADKKEMHKEVVDIQNTIGITGLSLTFKFTTSDGITLYSVTYK